MAKNLIALIALAFVGTAHAVSMSLTDGCNNSMSATGVALTANAAGDLTLTSTSTSTPYSVLFCDTNTAAPRCTLSASRLTVAPGGTSTLVAKCTSTPTGYTWIKPAGWADSLSGSQFDLTFPAAGSYTFAVNATYSGATAYSNPVTILVANPNDPPVCALTASPSSIHPGESTRLHATCAPTPSSYVWTVDNGSAKPQSTEASADVALSAAGVYTFDVKGQVGTQLGSMASATVTVSGTYANWAAFSAGAFVTASSFFDAGVTALKNGERAGNTFGAGGVWSSKAATLPDGFYVSLPATYAVDRVVLYSMQDDYEHAVEPTDTMTCQWYCARDFEIYHYNNGWQLLASVTGNNLVKRTVTFPATNVGSILIKMITMGTVGVTVARATEIEIYAGASANLVNSSSSITPNAGAASINDQSPPALNNGETKGLTFGAGGVWTDSSNAYPDWARIDFTGPRLIDRIVVFGMQDNYTNPVDPTDTLACSTYCVEDFQVQTWNGSAWVTQGSVTGNHLVKKTFTFAPVMTSAVRVYITKAATAGGDRSRLVEIQAWGY